MKSSFSSGPYELLFIINTIKINPNLFLNVLFLFKLIRLEQDHLIYSMAMKTNQTHFNFHKFKLQKIVHKNV